ncbi:MAG TPA: acyltransferase [Thermoanaerobaculia bacterium]|jgi:UDP-3-O-[3-hydroxymyristoyl] glucosamine N-acyltransferase
MLLDLLRGLWLLRSPLLRRRLGELRVHEEQVEELRRRFGARIDSDVVLHGTEHLRLGRNCLIAKGTVLATGDPLNGFGTLSIGANTYVGEYNNLRASAGGEIVIGDDCLISQFCTVVGANHDTSRSADMARVPAVGEGVRVGNGVWLGAGAALLPGVTIGEGAVVGANAVVTRPVPAYEIWGGSPARKIGERR